MAVRFLDQGEAARDAGKVETARACLRLATLADPGDETASYQLARSLTMLGSHAEAAQRAAISAQLSESRGRPSARAHVLSAR